MSHVPVEPIERWPDILQAHIHSNCSILRKVFVLRETDSTQDAARRMSACAGDVVIAWRQTAGRGRLGRTWADTDEHGVALTVAVPRNASEYLAIASAVGAAIAIEQQLGHQVGLKWPNDVMANGKKLAGILIEQAGDVALIGIGINVLQRTFPEPIADRAISLAQLGIETDRLVVICSLLQSLDRALAWPESELEQQFCSRDLLTGSMASFSMRGEIYTGKVTRIDPFRGLSIATAAGEEVWLTAAHASLVAADLAVAP